MSSLRLYKVAVSGSGRCWDSFVVAAHDRDDAREVVLNGVHSDAPNRTVVFDEASRIRFRCRAGVIELGVASNSLARGIIAIQSGIGTIQVAGATLECPRGHGQFIGVSPGDCPVCLGRSIGRTWTTEVGNRWPDPADYNDGDDL